MDFGIDLNHDPNSLIKNSKFLIKRETSEVVSTDHGPRWIDPRD